jgi:hypothetical protein
MELEVVAEKTLATLEVAGRPAAAPAPAVVVVEEEPCADRSSGMGRKKSSAYDNGKTRLACVSIIV